MIAMLCGNNGKKTGWIWGMWQNQFVLLCSVGKPVCCYLLPVTLWLKRSLSPWQQTGQHNIFSLTLSQSASACRPSWDLIGGISSDAPPPSPCGGGGRNGSGRGQGQRARSSHWGGQACLVTLATPSLTYPPDITWQSGIVINFSY